MTPQVSGLPSSCQTDFRLGWKLLAGCQSPWLVSTAREGCASALHVVLRSTFIPTPAVGEEVLERIGGEMHNPLPAMLGRGGEASSRWREQLGREKNLPSAFSQGQPVLGECWGA